MLSLAEEKKALELKEQFYKEQLQQDFTSLDGDYEKIGLWTLFGAAVVLCGYVVVKRFLPQKKGGVKRNYIFDQQGSGLVMQSDSSQETSPLVSKIKQHIALFILSIVKEKLNSLLKESQLNK
jgi:hypothetical protein